MNGIAIDIPPNFLCVEAKGSLLPIPFKKVTKFQQTGLEFILYFCDDGLVREPHFHTKTQRFGMKWLGPAASVAATFAASLVFGRGGAVMSLDGYNRAKENERQSPELTMIPFQEIQSFGKLTGVYASGVLFIKRRSYKCPLFFHARSLDLSIVNKSKLDRKTDDLLSVLERFTKRQSTILKRDVSLHKWEDS